MDGNSLTQTEVFSAFRVLFSLGSEVSTSTLEAIQLADLKKAYRKKALDTHPDRFSGYGEGYQKARSEQFIAVNEAYTTLSSFLKMRQENGFRLPRDNRQQAARSWKNADFYQQRAEKSTYSNPYTRESFSSFFWQKVPPQRPLRFGEYLFYSGVIPWSLLIKAIVWQRSQRPRIGEIAQNWRWLTESQIKALLKNRRQGERLGEILLRYSIINSFQLRLLLSHQQRIQKPFGSFFVQNRVLTEAQIKRYLEHQRSHNLRYDRKTARPPGC